MRSDVLEVKGLHCGYKTPVINGVDVNIRNGEVVALLGPNGAGKSTLIKCAMKLAKLFSGCVCINGRSVTHMTRQELARSISYVPQSHAVAFPMRVLDVVLMGRVPYASYRPSREDVKVALGALRRLGIEHLANKLTNELSGGQLQLVHIARALAQNGRVMLLDEPTSNLDIRHQVDVMETVTSIARDDGVAVLMTIHDINLAFKYADRVVLMKSGRIIFGSDPSDITPDILSDVYGVKVRMVDNNGRPSVLI